MGQLVCRYSEAGAHLTAADFTASLNGGGGGRGGKSASSSYYPTSTPRLASAKLALTDEAVAKVTPRGVTHLDMAPYDPSGPLVVAAGVGLYKC
jgi:hypothetical protein